MSRLLAVLLGAALALGPVRASASASWGSPQYGDASNFCTNQSDMANGGYATWPAENDPLISDNPDYQVSGPHSDPGYDDWYVWFYGDFRGKVGDSSGWTHATTDHYPNYATWSLKSLGWAVHGHAKMYLAYYNWTFGGQCGWGWYGNSSPPPYMAPQGGYGVMDFYVDAVAPFPPQPRVTDMTTSSITFGWDAVADQGDGSGQDYFAVGIGGYTSWLTLNGGSAQQLATTPGPRGLTASGLSSSDSVCVHVTAFDKLQNSTAPQVVCASPLSPPPMPNWPSLSSKVAANPSPNGLVGFPTWLWLNPTPGPITATEQYQGYTYRVTATPASTTWSFGDSSSQLLFGTPSFGQAYPQPSSVVHGYEQQLQKGYTIAATVQYSVTWSAYVNNHWVGPYPMGASALAAIPLTYPVEQAQPELMSAD